MWVFTAVQIGLGMLVVIPFFYWFWVFKKNSVPETNYVKIHGDLGTTVILPTRNEERFIQSKLETILHEVSDREDVQIIVADSDSTDNTRSISSDYLEASNLDRARWMVLNFKIRGKNAALNRCLEVVSSDIIVISDADANVRPGWLQIILERFSQPDIGVVSGIEDPESHKSGFFSSFYKKSSNKLRIKESKINSTPILEGSLLAWKTSYLTDFRLNENMNADDAQLSLAAIRNGKRSIVDGRISFTGFDDRKRSISEILRRSQGLTLALAHNWDLAIRPQNEGIRPILFNAMYLYILFPWVSLLSMFTAIFGVFYNHGSGHIFHSFIICLFILLMALKRGRALFLGISIVIICHLQLLSGKRYNRWEPVREI